MDATPQFTIFLAGSFIKRATHSLLALDMSCRRNRAYLSICLARLGGDAYYGRSCS